MFHVYLIAQALDAIMVSQYALILTLDHHANIRRQIFLQRLAIGFQRSIFFTLAFGEYRLIILTGNQRFDIEPLAMHAAADAAVCRGIATKGAHQLLQFGSRRSAPTRTL